MTCGAAKRHGVYVHLHLPTVSGSDRHYTSRTPRSTCYVSRGQYHGSQGAISAVLLVRDATRWRGSGRVTCYRRWEGQYNRVPNKVLKEKHQCVENGYALKPLEEQPRRPLLRRSPRAMFVYLSPSNNPCLPLCAATHQVASCCLWL